MVLTMHLSLGWSFFVLGLGLIEVGSGVLLSLEPVPEVDSLTPELVLQVGDEVLVRFGGLELDVHPELRPVVADHSHVWDQLLH